MGRRLAELPAYFSVEPVEPGKAGAFQPEPPGNLPVELEKPGRIFRFPVPIPAY